MRAVKPINNISGDVTFQVTCPLCGNVLMSDFNVHNFDTSTVWKEACEECDAVLEVYCSVNIDVDVIVTDVPTKKGKLYRKLRVLQAKQASLVKIIKVGMASPYQWFMWRTILEDIAEIDRELEKYD